MNCQEKWHAFTFSACIVLLTGHMVLLMVLHGAAHCSSAQTSALLLQR
jgi:hypothetical protein